jgi:hypothetical protein
MRSNQNHQSIEMAIVDAMRKRNFSCEPLQWSRFFQHCVTVFICGLALIMSACGGGGSGSSFTPTQPPAQNPVPNVASISPSNAPAGSRALTLTVTGSGFFAGSVVQWGGSARTTTFVSSTRLDAAINPGDLATAGTASVSVFNPSPGGGTSSGLVFSVSPVSPLTILTKRLPDAARSKEYAYALQASGGIQPYIWNVSAGTLPSGLTLAAGGAITGVPPAVSSDTMTSFTVQIRDNSYQPPTVTQPLGILVRSGSIGRNDSCATATPAANGVIRASISPYGDIDVYSFLGTAGNRVTIEIFSRRLDLYSQSAGTDIFLDSFLELLNSGCSQLANNDDISFGDNVDSLIADYTLPYTGTYYIRVSDIRSDGRPDFIYELHLSGAN